MDSKRITILGTSFKPDTDDVRDSIAITLIQKLLKLNADIIIHDPRAIENTRKKFREKIKYADSISNSIKNSHCVIIMTQWNEYKKLNNKMINQMKKKLIIDCRRLLIDKNINAEYYAIGIGK